MIFKGVPNMLVTVSGKDRRLPKDFRFNKDGLYETENKYLIERLRHRFEVVENKEESVKKPKEDATQKQAEVVKFSELSMHQIRAMAKAKGVNSFGKTKQQILKEMNLI